VRLHRFPLLALFALFTLVLAPGFLLGQDLPVATPVDPATALPAGPAAPGLPAPALLIAVVVPLIIAGLKRIFPKIPGSLLPILAPVLGGLLEALLTSLGADAGGLATGVVAGSAGTGLREIVDQHRKSLPAAAALLLIALVPVFTGCTSFVVEQGDTSPERAITFKLRGHAWFSGSQTIANLKAIQTDKSQSFGTDSINNRGPTNAVAVIEAATKLVEAAKTP
jgi:hypothetical protein